VSHLHENYPLLKAFCLDTSKEVSSNITPKKVDCTSPTHPADVEDGREVENELRPRDNPSPDAWDSAKVGESSFLGSFVNSAGPGGELYLGRLMLCRANNASSV